MYIDPTLVYWLSLLGTLCTGMALGMGCTVGFAFYLRKRHKAAVK